MAYREKLKSYQQPVFDAIDSGVKKVVAVMPRRSGKTTVSSVILENEALKDVGDYYWFIHSYRLTPHLPLTFDKNGICSLENGSRIIVVPFRSKKALESKENIKGVVYEEYAFAPEDFKLLDIEGWELFIGTPRGKNKFKEISECDDVFLYKITIEDTDIDKSILDDQLLSKELISQEFYCEFL